MLNTTIRRRLIFRGTPPTLFAAMSLAVPSAGASQEDADASAGGAQVAERCADPEHRQFDFWLGTWEVRDSEGNLQGHNEVRRVARGCALLESWRGASGSRGVSINTYDVDRKKWTQRWVGDGATLWLEGDLEDGRMRLAGTTPRSTSDGPVLDRISWSPLPDGRVRQTWEISRDAGATWQPIFEGFYARTGTTEPAGTAAVRMLETAIPVHRVGPFATGRSKERQLLVSRDEEWRRALADLVDRAHRAPSSN